VQVAHSLEKNHRNKTRIDPTIAIIINNMFTDFRYLFVSGLILFFENAPAPKEITMKKRNTKTSIVMRIPNLPNIFI